MAELGARDTDVLGSARTAEDVLFCVSQTRSVPSLLAVATMCAFTGLNEVVYSATSGREHFTLLDRRSVPYLCRTVQARGQHLRAVKATAWIGAECPASVRTWRALLSPLRAVPSVPPVTTILPSGLTAAAFGTSESGS